MCDKQNYISAWTSYMRSSSLPLTTLKWWNEVSKNIIKIINDINKTNKGWCCSGRFRDP